MNEPEAILHFTRLTADLLRKMPFSDARHFLRGLLCVATPESLTDLRTIYQSVCESDAQLELLAAPQMTLPLVESPAAIPTPEKRAFTQAPVPKPPFVSDLVHPHFLYTHRCADAGCPSLSLDEWAYVDREPGALLQFHADYDAYRAGRSEHGDAPLGISQFLAVWREGRAAGWEPESMQSALRFAEQEAGLNPQAVS